MTHRSHIQSSNFFWSSQERKIFRISLGQVSLMPSCNDKKFWKSPTLFLFMPSFSVFLKPPQHLQKITLQNKRTKKGFTDGYCICYGNWLKRDKETIKQEFQLPSCGVKGFYCVTDVFISFHFKVIWGLPL